MFRSLYRRILSWSKNDKNRSIALLAVVLMSVTGVILLVLDGSRSFAPLQKLTRNSYGGGERTEALKVEIEGHSQKEDVQVELSEQQYTSAEIKELFGRCMGNLDRHILGDNESLDRIESDMNLIKSISGQPIDVEWELDRYDVMNVNGELQKSALHKKGDMVHLKAVLTYQENAKDQAMYECVAMVYPKKLTGQEKLAAEVQSALKKAEKKTKTKKVVELPRTVGTSGVTYYHSMDSRGGALILMAVLSGVLFYALEKQNQYKSEQEKKKQMLMDYPEIISKFTLLLSAGMTVKNVWKKVISDYEKQKAERGNRYAYEEMKITWNEMQSGITEAESYERFGKRCGLQTYMKFGALLSQNLRKGTKGLTNILKTDALQVFEERKARARRMGEEAGTKLLLPMFLMLSIVLVIVVVPAFLSMQM